MRPLDLVVGFLPVVLFLAALVALDSYKLVTRRQVLASLAWGAVAAAVSYEINASLLGPAGLDPLVLKRYVAPVIEEALKGAFVVVLIARARVGFLVDAGVRGFAAGTGFALVENAWYAHALGDPNPWLWVLRGLGTAVLHGSTTSLLAIVSKSLTDRHGARALLPYLPGFAIAVVMHSAYNHLMLNPLLTTALLLLVMPLALFAAFEMSDRATREWLGHGLDEDVELLELVHSGEVAGTPAGAYLHSLRRRFPGAVVADMLCLLEIRLELALRAKGLLIAQGAGVEVTMDDNVRANLDELRFLERSIGPTGRLAMRPLLPEGRERWQIRLLEMRRGRANSAAAGDG